MTSKRQRVRQRQTEEKPQNGIVPSVENMTPVEQIKAQIMVIDSDISNLTSQVNYQLGVLGGKKQLLLEQLDRLTALVDAERQSALEVRLRAEILKELSLKTNVVKDTPSREWDESPDTLP